MTFEPDYRIIVDAATNRKPSRLPIYEHAIDESIMALVLGADMNLQGKASQICAATIPGSANSGRA